MNIYKFELKRAFKIPSFYLSLIVGCIITIVDWTVYALPQAQSLDVYMADMSQKSYPVSAFIMWIGGERSKFASLYFLILPLLVVVPYAHSFYTDNKSTYINFIVTRVIKKEYFKAKFLAVFLSGGCVAVVPLILNFMMTAMVLPCVNIQTAMGGKLLPKSSFTEIYYNYPMLFVCISLLMIFIFAGIMAVSSLYIAFYSKWSFSVTLFPFILSLVIMSVADLSNMKAWEIMNFLNPVFQSPRFLPFIIEAVILLCIAVWEFIIKGSCQDCI